MALPTDPIFVFTDALAVHCSLSEAAVYHEFRDALVAYDQWGRVFELPRTPGAAPKLRSEKQRAELVRKLRRALISLAISRPDLLQMSKWDVKHAADNEIIRLAVRWFLIPRPRPRAHWWQVWRPRSA